MNVTCDCGATRDDEHTKGCAQALFLAQLADQSGRTLSPEIKTIRRDGEVRPHFAETVWGVLVWPGHVGLERVDEYTNREKAEEMLRTCYGRQATLVCREIGAWQVPDV